MKKLQSVMGILFAASMIVVTGTTTAQTFTATELSVNEAIVAVKEKAAKAGEQVDIVAVMPVGENFVKANAVSK